MSLHGGSGLGAQTLFSYPGPSEGKSFAIKAATVRCGFQLPKSQQWVTISLLLVLGLILRIESSIAVFIDKVYWLLRIFFHMCL